MLNENSIMFVSHKVREGFSEEKFFGKEFHSFGPYIWKFLAEKVIFITKGMTNITPACEALVLCLQTFTEISSHIYMQVLGHK